MVSPKTDHASVARYSNIFECEHREIPLMMKVLNSYYIFVMFIKHSSLSEH